MQMYFETWVFEAHTLASLARAYNLQFFLSVHLGDLPPPPTIPKSWLRYCPSRRSNYLIPPPPHHFFVVVACLSAFRPENEDPFYVRTFFFGGAGGGGTRKLSAQNVSAPLRKPKAPSDPPTEKILATPLSHTESSTKRDIFTSWLLMQTP